MSTSLTISGLKSSIAWSYASTDALGGSVVSSNSVAYSKTLANGTGAGNAQKLYFDKFTLAASGSTNRDLAASLTDVFGNTLTFSNVKSIYCEVTTTYTGSDLNVGGGSDGAGAAAFSTFMGSTTGTIKVLNGGFLHLGNVGVTGYAVTATTGDILHFANTSGATSCEVQLVIVGE